MPQGNTLGTPRAPAGVQDQGDIVSRRRGCGNGGGGSAHELNVALFGHFHREHRDLAVGGRAACEFCAYRRTKQNARVGVSEEKEELLIRVRQVQRSCRSSDGSGEKADNRRQAVRQCDRYRIATANPHGGQGVRHGQNLLPERIVGDLDSELWNDNGRVTVSEMQNVEKSVYRLHCHSLPPLARSLDHRPIL